MTLSKACEIYEQIQKGRIMSSWHWLQYNFTPGTQGSRYFAPVTLHALAAVDDAIPGFSSQMVRRLEGMGGRDRDLGHYEQIVQWLAELLVIRHLVSIEWPTGTAFSHEPTAGTSKKNPEIVITVPSVGALGVEVKCPRLVSHRANRNQSSWQFTARDIVDPQDLEGFEGGVVLNKDNPVKDFLASADGKFAEFHSADPKFRSILVIVWDDSIYEPLSALMAPSSGLLTPNSFHKRDDGLPVTYQNVDAVLVIRHQHQFVLGMKNESPWDDRRDFMDYGLPGAFPPHVLIPTASGRPLDDLWQRALRGWPLEAVAHMAEYRPTDLVMGADPSHGS